MAPLLRRARGGAMGIWDFLTDVTILLGAGLVLGALAERLGQSAILGYLLAGALLGPNALGWIAGGPEVDAFAELGVALLLFAIGLEFSWSRLRSMGLLALGGGTVQVLATLGLGAGALLVLGRDGRTALAVGAIVALSSTACVLRSLAARGEMESVHGRQALGVLLLQDIAVVPLVLLLGVLAQGGGPATVLVELGRTLALGAALIGVLVVLFRYVAPRALASGALRGNRELPILFAVVSAIGSALACHAIGVSPALGAFVAGMLLAESPFATQVRADVSALRTLLVTLFFTTIGMLADPGWMAAHPGLVLAALAAVLVGKTVVVWGALRLFGAPGTPALASGIALAQIGEFSFVLAAVGRGRVLSEDAFLLIVSTSVLTLFLTPYLVDWAPRLAARLSGRRRAALREADGEPPVEGIVVFGFGPAGRAVCERLAHAGLPLVVVDLNPAACRAARQLGHRAVIGDGQHAEVLEEAGIEHARFVVVTLPQPSAVVQVVRLVRALAPHAQILCRARYHLYRHAIEQAGAHVVVDEEQDVGRAIARAFSRLRRLEGHEPGARAADDGSDAEREAEAEAEAEESAAEQASRSS